MGFDSYKGSIELGAGLTPSGTGYPLMQSCDIQVDEAGKRLDALLEELASGGSSNPGLSDVINLQNELISQIKSSLARKMSGEGIIIPTPEDEGKFLSVVNGVLAWVSLPVAEDIVITIAEEINLNG